MRVLAQQPHKGALVGPLFLYTTGSNILHGAEQRLTKLVCMTYCFCSVPHPRGDHLEHLGKNFEVHIMRMGGSTSHRDSEAQIRRSCLLPLDRHRPARDQVSPMQIRYHTEHQAVGVMTERKDRRRSNETRKPKLRLTEWRLFRLHKSSNILHVTEQILTKPTIHAIVGFVHTYKELP